MMNLVPSDSESTNVDRRVQSDDLPLGELRVEAHIVTEKINQAFVCVIINRGKF